MAGYGSHFYFEQRIGDFFSQSTAARPSYHGVLELISSPCDG